MALAPQKFRESVLQILYSRSFDCAEEEIIPFLMQELKTTQKAMREAHLRAETVWQHREEIDAKIRDASKEYQFERISLVEKSVLRLGLFELFFDPKIPPKVAIAEAIRLCRKFGTPESAQFVNAILDGVYQSHAAFTTNESAPL